MVPLTVGVSSTSINLIETILQRHAEMLIPQATLDTIKLAIDIYNHTLILAIILKCQVTIQDTYLFASSFYLKLLLCYFVQ